MYSYSLWPNKSFNLSSTLNTINSNHFSNMLLKNWCKKISHRLSRSQANWRKSLDVLNHQKCQEKNSEMLLLKNKSKIRFYQIKTLIRNINTNQYSKSKSQIRKNKTKMNRDSYILTPNSMSMKVWTHIFLQLNLICQVNLSLRW